MNTIGLTTTKTHDMLGDRASDPVVANFRTKLIDDAKRPDPQYRGLVHGTMTIIRNEGILGIYRGLFPVVRVRYGHYTFHV